MVKSNLGHLQIGVHPTHLPFYKELFKFLGWSVLCDEPTMFGTGDANGTSLWFASPLKEVKNDYDGIGMNHLGLAVPSQKDVDDTVAFLKEHGVKALFETPRHRPDFCSSSDQTYYQVMFESPDRILFEVVYTGPKTA